MTFEINKLVGRLWLCSINYVLAGCIALIAVVPGAHAQAVDTENAPTAEQKVKAASLFRFVSYVEWPPESFAQPTTPYLVGVTSADDIANELIRISSTKTLNNRPLKVRKLFMGDTLRDIHVLFIGVGGKAQQAHWLRLAQNLPILTVTETDGGLHLGSMINFRIVDDRVRFEVGLDAVEKSSLRISSRMLSVAVSVHKNPL